MVRLASIRSISEFVAGVDGEDEAQADCLGGQQLVAVRCSWQHQLSDVIEQ